ncbi:fatty acid-binding protein 2-like [Cydia pomonella]|uniref:fatty acid-binding protein 2-like n=1 Tax=Cydia pomonella TaxID=82600 RepID=UPI002ADE8E61|nr:fatty acid-binding protein 2-like [Cydia pomonella]
MSYIGKAFTFEKHEKFDEFLASLGVPKEKIDELCSHKISLVLEKNGNTYNMKLLNKTISFQSGVEFDETLGDGHQCKTICVVEGDTVTHTQKHQNGRIITFKKQYSDNKLVETATNNVWDGVAYRYYSA